MKKIGILGGTFNPIHNGHLGMARKAVRQYKLDEVWFVPSGNPPHKSVSGQCTGRNRYEMCLLAVEDEPAFFVCDLEIGSLEQNYSYKTMQYFAETYTDCQFYFILGEDSLRDFHRWVHPEKICEIADILVATREDQLTEYPDQCDSGDEETTNQRLLKFQSLIDYENETFGSAACFYPIKMDTIRISSSMIRRKIANGEEISPFVPQHVQKYIQDHHLYKEKMEMKSIEKIQKDLEQKLKKSRYTHTIGVMHMAASLAMCYEYPIENAFYAGLLHDCAKYMTPAELLEFCQKNDIAVTEAEKSMPQLLHAKAGAYIAREEYHVTDQEILHAISVHTTGIPAMNLLDKILFVADYIEPNRVQAPRLSEVRSLAFHDLDVCVATILSDTILYLESLEQPIDNTTYETYHFYREKLQKKGQDVSLRS